MEDAIVFRKHCEELFGVALISIALFIFISILGYTPADYPQLLANAPTQNMAGPVGAWMAHITRSIFGMASYCVVPLLIIPGLFLVKNDFIKRTTEKSLIILLLTVLMSAVIPLFTNNVPQLSGGYAGIVISGFFVTTLGRAGSYIVLSSLMVLNLVALLILFLSPKHKYFPVASEGKRGSSGLGLKRRDESFRTDGGVSRNKKDAAFPWIVKKKIVVYETEPDGVYGGAVHPQKIPVSYDPEILLTGKDNGDNTVRFLDHVGHGGSIGCDETDLVLGEDEYVVNNCGDAEERYDDMPDEDQELNTEESESGCDADEECSGENIPIEDDREQEPVAASGINTSGQEIAQKRVFDEIRINEEYIIPKTYLSSSKPLDAESWKNEIRKNSILLKNTLADFGIEADVVNVNRGPVITLYEMQIAPGIKVNRIVGLADDIAMALAAQRVRIVAPIPGKSAIGVEIPNLYRETVTLGDIIKSKEFHEFRGHLVVALGKDILGKPVMIDLKTQPHLLIAGTTGSGKSVCVNSIITSLLYNYNPNYVRFILVDPKMVELQLYNGLPHLLTPVIVDPQIAPMVLKWTMREMERRYYLLSELNTRDIERYNEKIGQQKKKDTEKLPYIVVIIDEMADLMMSSKEVEGYITRIAQKSRAVGIHLVVATQRPSVDIITGLIKANFPARVAFQVAQKTDSRTIIDQNGAEKLLGRGDLLYQPPTSSFPIRVQGGFISEEEIEKITGHLCRLGRPSYIDIEESLTNDEDSAEMEEAADELFQEALKIIEETKKASASYLQRRLSIGYNRAARIIELMEDMGYIGPQIGSKPREVFI